MHRQRPARPEGVAREGTSTASTSAPEIPAWLDLDKVVPTQVLEAMHDLAEEVQALKRKIADLGQTGSELELEYKRYLDKAFGPCLTTLARHSAG